jgi:hypothetical protein
LEQVKDVLSYRGFFKGTFHGGRMPPKKIEKNSATEHAICF